MEPRAEVKEQVKQKYGERRARRGGGRQFAGVLRSGLRCCDPITTNLYSDGEKGLLPEKAVLASLGCGNPTALLPN